MSRVLQAVGDPNNPTPRFSNLNGALTFSVAGACFVLSTYTCPTYFNGAAAFPRRMRRNHRPANRRCALQWGWRELETHRGSV
jgi:hypothetical protein